MKHLILLFSLVLSIGSVAQTDFEAKVSRTQIGLNENLKIDFIISGDGDNFQPPTFDGFDVARGGQSVSNIIMNGRQAFKRTVTYFLTPLKKGTLTVGQAQVTVNGQILKTSPIQIKVTAAVNQPNDPNSPDRLIGDKIQMITEVSNPNPYLNEAITVVYKIYVSPSLRVPNWDPVDIPQYNDFWSQEIQQGQMKVENCDINGVRYRCDTLKRAVLYPQKTGELTIEPLTLDVNIEVETERRDFWGNRIRERIKRRVSSKSRIVETKPLPLEGRPANFSGAVGDFNITMETNKTSLDVGESLEAELKITGNGNLKLLDFPNFDTAATLQVYEPEQLDRVRTTLKGMTGSVGRRYTIVPQEPGNYPIPSVSISYFDLTSKSYKTIATQEVMLNVGGAAVLNNTTTSSTGNGQFIPQATGQFGFIKTATTFIGMEEEPFFGSKLFWLLFFTPLLFIPLLIVFKKLTKRTHNNKISATNTADKLSKKFLSVAKKNIGNSNTFYVSLERALHNFTKAKLNIATTDMSKGNIKNVLSSKGASDSSIEQYLHLLSSCELARYAPTSPTGMQQDYETAAATINALDKEL